MIIGKSKSIQIEFQEKTICFAALSTVETVRETHFADYYAKN